MLTQIQNARYVIFIKVVQGNKIVSCKYSGGFLCRYSCMYQVAPKLFSYSFDFTLVHTVSLIFKISGVPPQCGRDHHSTVSLMLFSIQGKHNTAERSAPLCWPWTISLTRLTLNLGQVGPQNHAGSRWDHLMERMWCHIESTRADVPGCKMHWEKNSMSSLWCCS